MGAGGNAMGADAKVKERPSEHPAPHVSGAKVRKSAPHANGVSAANVTAVHALVGGNATVVTVAHAAKPMAMSHVMANHVKWNRAKFPLHHQRCLLALILLLLKSWASARRCSPASAKVATKRRPPFRRRPSL